MYIRCHENDQHHHSRTVKLRQLCYFIAICDYPLCLRALNQSIHCHLIGIGPNSKDHSRPLEDGILLITIHLRDITKLLLKILHHLCALAEGKKIQEIMITLMVAVIANCAVFILSNSGIIFLKEQIR